MDEVWKTADGESNTSGQVELAKWPICASTIAHRWVSSSPGKCGHLAKTSSVIWGRRGKRSRTEDGSSQEDRRARRRVGHVTRVEAEAEPETQAD